MPKGDKLTKKQEAFVQAYLKCLNPTQAYRKSHDAKNMSDDACRVEGNKLVKHPTISLRIAKATEKAITKAALTVESILEELEEARQMAKLKENPSAMAQASMGKAKVGGLIVEKKEVGGVHAFKHATDEELDEVIATEAVELLPGSSATH